MAEVQQRGRRTQKEELHLRALGAELRFAAPVFIHGRELVGDVRIETVANEKWLTWKTIVPHVKPHEVWNVPPMSFFVLPEETKEQSARSFRLESRCLADLLDLQDAEDNAIQAFVSLHGPLGLLRSHMHGVRSLAVAEGTKAESHSTQVSDDDGRYGEPIELYRLFSQRCSMILTLMYRMERGYETREKDWKAVLPDSDYDFTFGPAGLARRADWETMERRWLMSLLIRLVQDSLDRVPLYISLSHMTDALTLHITDSESEYGSDSPIAAQLLGKERYEALSRDRRSYPYDLLGMLWNPDTRRGMGYFRSFHLVMVQLAAALSRGVFVCDVCQRPFELQAGRRRPKGGRAVLCNNPECHREQARRISQRHYEQKMKAKRKDQSNG